MTPTNRLYSLLLLLVCVPAFTQQKKVSPPKATIQDIRLIDSLNIAAYAQKNQDAAKTLNGLFNAESLASDVQYKKGLAINYLYQGQTYQHLGYDQQALSTFHKALPIFRELKDTFHIAFTSHQMGQSLKQNGKLDEALKLYNESFRVFTILKNQEEVINIRNNIAEIELMLNNFERAANGFKTSLNASIAAKYSLGERKSYYLMGLLEEKRKNYNEAATNYVQSLYLNQLKNDRYGAAKNELQLGILNNTKNMPGIAVNYAKDAYKDASFASATNIQKEAASLMIEVYRKNGDIQKASQWQDSLVKILNLQNANERNYALNYIEVIKNQDILKANAESQAENAIRVQKEQLLIITVGTFILIIVAVLAVLALVNYQRQRYFGKELKQKNEIIEMNSESLDKLNKEISQQNILLEEDNKTKSKLLSIISHDLRTPLVNTKGVLNLVNQGMVPPEETDRLLQLLETQYIGTTSLLDNLLFWIKGQMEGKEDEKVKVSLYHLVKSLEDEQRLPLMKKHIAFKNLIDKGISIMVEKEMIRIVCRNLISNAIKFTNENGSIELSSKIDPEQNLIHLTVKDSGIGMTKEAIAKVNAKQYYNTTGTSLEKGSGFGLMLCRDLISKNGGELIIESEPGKGSAFTLTFPFQHA